MMEIRRTSGGIIRTPAVLMGVAWLLMAVCGGCAHKAPAKLTIPVTYAEKGKAEGHFWPDPSLKSVFERYWAARLQGDSDTAFEMEAPYFQEMIPKGLYKNYVKNARNNEWLGMELVNLIQDPAYFVELSMRLTYKGRKMRPGTVFMKDRWVEVEGQWYHVLRDRLIFPAVSETG